MTPDTWNHETYDVEDLAVGQIKMKNGAVIDLKASWALNMAEDAGAFGDAKVKLCGTKGGLDTHTGVVRLNHVVAGQPHDDDLAERWTLISPALREESLRYLLNIRFLSRRFSANATCS